MQKNFNGSRKNHVKKIAATFAAFIMVLTTMSAMVTFFAAPVGADGPDPSIWTTDIEGNPKYDFAPGDIVYIHGEEFLAEHNVDVDVTRPDTAVESGSTTSEADGTFVYEYDLNGIAGEYTVDATDGTNSNQTTFIDATYTVKSYSDSGHTVEENDFVQGDTVYGKATKSSDAYYLRLRYYDPSNNEVHTCTSGSKVTSYTCDYSLPGGAPTGQWTIKFYAEKYDSTPDELKDTHYFNVACATGCNSDADCDPGETCIGCGCYDCTTLLDDGFEAAGAAWDDNWDDNGATDWHQSTNQHTGTYAAEATSGTSEILTSDNLDASGADFIVVDFWFKKEYISSNDFTLCYYDGSNYDNVAELDGLGRDDQWLHYTDTITDSQYFHSNFRIRFDGYLDSSWDYVRVDDVLIKKCSEAAPPEDLDFGDAPDSYSTVVASNGARHTIVPGWHLGPIVDAEPDGQPSPLADGDDLNPPGAPDDEDGVTLPPVLTPGNPVAAVLVDGGPSGGMLDAWIDFNGNGVFDHPSEHLWGGASMPLGPGPNPLLFSVLPGATPGITYARFRLSMNGGLPPTGPAPDGEVEDYLVEIEEALPDMDFGDAPDDPYPTLLPNGARHVIDGVTYLGASVDAEQDGQPDPNALGDDNDGNDDEDGVVFNQPWAQGQPASIMVNASVAGKLDAWVDFNADGDWVDAGEQIFNSKQLNAGANIISFLVPITATVGDTFARFRFSTLGGLSPEGQADDGEVEDYKITIGDWNPTCLIPNNLGDDVLQYTCNGDLQTIFNNYPLLIHVNSDLTKTRTQIWDFECCGGTVTLEFEFVGKEAGNSNVFGYYLNKSGDIIFTPLFQSGSHDGYSVPSVSPGYITSPVVIPKAGSDYIGFAIVSDDDTGPGVGSNHTFFTENSLNPEYGGNPEDHALVFNLSEDEYIVCFEDLNYTTLEGTGCQPPAPSGTPDFDDVVVIVRVLECTCDDESPDITKIVGDPNVTGKCPPNPDYWVTTATEITATVTDDEGVYDVYYNMWNVTNFEDEYTNGYTWWFDESTVAYPISFDGTCEHVLSIKAVDACGNTEYDNETFYVDETGADQTIEFGQLKDETSGLVRVGRNTPIWLNSTDKGCNGGVGTEKLIYRVYAGYDHDHMHIITGPITVEDNDDNDTDDTDGRISVILYMNESCAHQIDLECWDLLGNYNWNAINFFVDADGPVVDKDIGWPQCGDFVNFSTKIWLNATDFVHANPNCSVGDIAKICWNITVNEVTTNYCKDGDKANFTFTEECNHTLEFWAVDALGNEGPIPHATQWHLVDDTPPTTIKEYGNPKCGCECEPYITSHTPIYLNATDGGLCKVGGVTIYYQVCYNGTWTSLRSSTEDVNLTMEELGFPWNQSCEHYIEYYAVDCLGNTEELHNQTFYVDNEGPEVDKEFSQPNFGPDGLFVTTETTIWLNATDLEGECASGVKKIYWNITKPDETYQVYSVTDDKAQFQFEENCTHWLEFWAVDCLDNEGVHIKQPHYVDEEPPKDNWSYIPPETTIKIGIDRYISNRTIKRINVTDRGCKVGGAGVCKIEWRVTRDNPNPPGNIANGTVYDNGSCVYDMWHENVSVSGDNNLTPGVMSIDISIDEDCQHYIFYTLVDCLGNRGEELKQPVRVDTQPPEITKTHPTHGWYPINETHSYLKCGAEINLTAIDLPQGICKSGLQAMYYRYVWNTLEFGDIDGQYLADLYAIDDDPAISGHDWYLYTGNFTFSQECIHDLYYWAVDNVSNYGPIHHQIYFVDNTPPTIHIDYPTHGYVPIGDTSGYLKCFTNITLNATDWPEPPCQAGVESIFWRYEYDGGYYPPDEPNHGDWDAVHGSELAGDYGYTDPNVINHWWYRVDDPTVDIWFERECVHELYYWAKDNVCNRSDIYHYTYYVDNTPPDIEVLHPEDHGYVPIDCDSGYLKCHTNITLKANELAGTSSDPSMDEDVLEAIENGTAFLAGQQNPDGSWGSSDKAAYTGFVLIKLQDYAYELGYSPFDPGYIYSTNVINGWQYLFSQASTQTISSQDHTSGATGTWDDPDTNGNGYGIHFGGGGHKTYTAGVCLMALVSSGTPHRPFDAGPETFKDIAQDVVDWLAFAQGDSGLAEGGWRYTENYGDSDNSVSGYAVLGLAAAESIVAKPGATAFACTVPSWVKTELNVFINNVQDPVDGDAHDGGSWYVPHSWAWVNELKTGNLIFEMTFYGDSPSAPRFMDAMDYIERHWQDANNDPGWGYTRNPAHYQAIYCLMKGLEYSGIDTIDLSGIGGSPVHDWYEQFSTVLMDQQNPADGSWPAANYGDKILNTAWALFTLEKIAPQITERCVSGVESIFWRYEFEGNDYPEDGDTHGFPIVTGDELNARYDYDEPEIVNNWWYQINDTVANVWFEEQCIHDLYYWTKDNVSNRGEIYYHRYHVDNTPPVVTRATGQPNCTVEGKTFVRTTTPIWINATDEGICQAGVESIFFRYEWNESFFPPSDNGYVFQVVSGIQLQQDYGYDNENITDYLWYRVDDDTVMFTFPEECIHKLYYWAKDNVCNRSEIYNHTYYVDDTPPYTNKTFDGPVYHASQEDIDKFNLETGNEINNFWLRDKHTWVILNATDREAPCAVGITYLHVELWWDSNGDDIIDTLLWSREVYDQDEDPYYDSNRSLGGIQYKFQIMEDCLHEIRWYTVDCLGNTETMPPQHVNFNLFYDDFETDLSKWTTSCFASRKNDSYSIDNYYAQLKSKSFWHGWMYTTVDTTGYGNIKLSYHARTRDAEQNDELKVAYKIGTGSWNPLNQINNDEWQVYTHDLVGAENKPVVKIKFRMDCNDWDYGLVDNVIVTGTKETDMHVQRHRVDSTPPKIVKIVGEPSDYWGKDEYGHDIWDVTTDTEINLDQTYDQEGPCAVGVESIKYKIWFLGNWTEWIDYTENITFSEHCTHYLLVNATDYLGNYALDNETFIVHAEVGEHPTLISPIDGALLNYSEITFEWNPVIGRDNYRVEWSTDVHFETFEYANVTGSQHTVILPDGTYYWHVAIIYTGGTIGQWSDTWSFTIDTTEPVISDIDSNDDDDVVIAGTTLVLTVTEASSEAGLSGTITITGATSGVVVDAQGLIDNLDGTYYYEYPIPEDEIAEQYTVTATLEDTFGNKDDDGLPTYTYTVIPTAGPIIENLVADPDEVSSEDVTITATASNTESIIEAAEYFINTIGTSGLGTPMSASDGTFDSTTEDITALVDNEDLDEGVNRIYVHAKDEAQNWGSFEQVIVVKDSVAPEIDDIYSNDDDDVVIAGTTLVLTVVEDNAESGLSGTITITGTTSGVVVDAQGLIDNLDGTYYYEYPIPEDEIAEQYTVTATLEDAFGNKDDDGFPTYTYTVLSTSGPTSHILDIDPYSTSDDPTLIAEITSDEAQIAYGEYKIDLDGDVVELLSEGLYGTYEYIEQVITLPGDITEGTHILFMRARDENNNWGAWDEEEFVFYIEDTMPPGPVEMLMHLDDGLGEYECDADGDITVVWTKATDDNSGVEYYEFEVELDEEPFMTYLIPDDGLPNDYATFAINDLPEGEFTMRVRAVDYAGHEGPWSDPHTVIVDKTAPELEIVEPEIIEPEDRYVSGIVTIGFTDTEITDPMISIDGLPYISTTTDSTYIWDTTDELDAQHFIMIKDTDLAGHTGYSQYGYWLWTNNHDEDEPDVHIVNPINGTTHSGTVTIQIEAEDDLTPTENLLVEVIIDRETWPYADDPDFRRIATYDGEQYFTVDIDVSKYTDRTELWLYAWATDEADKSECALPVTIFVESGIEFDQWMHKSSVWNTLFITNGAIGCSDLVEDVFASIDGKYDWIYYRDPTQEDGWRVWNRTVQFPWMNDLVRIEEQEFYSVYMNADGRLYLDKENPIITIEYPDVVCLGDFEDDIGGTAYDATPYEIVIMIYDPEAGDDGEYWDGEDWTPDYTELSCELEDGEWYYDDTGEVDWESRNGHTIEITATITDMHSCQDSDMVSFIYDDQPPEVDILDPQDGQVRNEGMGDVNVRVIELETHVTSVWVQICDTTANPDLYWNGAGWDTNDDNWFPCIYDSMEDWWYNDTGEVTWTNGHTYDLNAKAYDCPENEGTDTNTFTIDWGDPYVEITVPEPEEGIVECPLDLIAGTAFDDETSVVAVYIEIENTTDGTWWNGTGQWDDSEGPDTWLHCDYVAGDWTYTGYIPWMHMNEYTIHAFALDETFLWWEGSGNPLDADELNIGEDEVSFYFECEEPSISLTKTVWNETLGDWDEYVEVPNGSVVTFNITIHNSGNCELYDVYLVDELPPCLNYTVGNVSIYGYYDPSMEPTITYDWEGTGITLLEWGGEGAEPMPPGVIFSFELNVTVVSCGLDNENYVYIWADSDGGDVEADDTATVYGICEEPCMPEIELTKKVWCDTYGWVDEIGAINEDTVRFNLSIHNNGECCDLSDISVVDYLPSELTYAGDYTVVYDGGITDYNFDQAGNVFWWNFTGSLLYCHWIYIEFNAIVDFGEPPEHSCSTENWAQAEGWCNDYMDYMLDLATIDNWACT